MNRSTQPGHPERRTATVGLASTALVAATPPAAYYLIGDQSEDVLAGDPDYFMRPPSWSPTIVSVVGLLSLAAVTVSILVLLSANRRARVRQTTLWIDGLLVLAGVLAAGSYRVATAGVSGANMGAGMVILFGTPVLLGLLVGAGVIAMTDRRRAANSPRHD